jgi:hypothetical protein
MPVTRRKVNNLKIAREIIIVCQAILCSLCSPSTRIDRMLKFSFASPLLRLLAISLSLAITGCEDVESEPFEFAPSAFVTPTSAERATYEAAIIAPSAATAATLPVSPDDEPIYAFLEQILTDHSEVFQVFLGFDTAYAGRPLFLSVARGASGLLRTNNVDIDYSGKDNLDGEAGYWGVDVRTQEEIAYVLYVAAVVKNGVVVGTLYTEFGPLAPKQ